MGSDSHQSNANDAAKFEIVSRQHGCCIPGSCTNDDAIKLVTASPCYTIFFKYFSNLTIEKTNNHDDIFCSLEPREYTTGFWIVLSIFLFFVIMVVITTCYRHYYNSYVQ